jgi:hypothetical protein
VARRVVNGTLGTAEAAPRKIRPRIIYEAEKPGARLIWVWRGLLSRKAARKNVIGRERRAR